MYQALAVLTFCQSESHSLLSGTRPSAGSLRWLFCDSLFRGVEACQAPFAQGNLASILDASIHHTEEGILRSRGVTHWLVMGRWLHSPTCTTNDYAKAVLTTFVVLRCAFCKLRRNFVCCLVNHLSGGGVNATQKETKRIEISNHKSQTMTFWARSSKRMFRKRSEVR